MRRGPTYDEAPEYPSAVRIAGYSGIACRVLGWETEADEDTEWSGIRERTGRLVCRMVGDDRSFVVDPDDVETLARSAYCGECGQIGCHHDGYTPDDDDEDT